MPQGLLLLLGAEVLVNEGQFCWKNFEVVTRATDCQRPNRAEKKAYDSNHYAVCGALCVGCTLSSNFLELRCEPGFRLNDDLCL